MKQVDLEKQHPNTQQKPVLPTKKKKSQELDEQYESESSDDEQQLVFDDQDQDCMQQYNLTSSKMIKIGILALMLLFILIMLSTSLQSILFSIKSFTKTTGTQSSQQYSSLDQQGWRSYYYFKQIQSMARYNVENNKKIDLSLVMNKFGDISFTQLLRLFKVLKSIQYAKNYTTSLQGQKQKQDYNNPVNQQDLVKPYNYTSYFLAAANQYRCSSCYSFPVTATIEYIYKKYKNITVKLSEQQLIDCSAQDDLIDGCTSGNITKSFEYAQNVGLVSQDDYPYRSKGGHSYKCRKQVIQNPNVKKYKIGGFRILPRQNCQAIQAQLAQGNTVASMLSIDGPQLSSFRQQDGRPYRNCPKDDFNHAITIVGQTEKQDWIVRNSWGISWGQNGYFTLRRGDTCNVCKYSMVPYF